MNTDPFQVATKPMAPSAKPDDIRPSRPSAGKVLREIFSAEAAQRRPVSVALRFAAWQLWRRLWRKPMPFRTVTGSRLLLIPNASDSLSGFWYHQLPDFEELLFALHLLQAGDLFVDVGANQGGWSLVLAGRSVRVLAFEPIPNTHRRMLACIAENPPEIQRNIRVVPVGLGENDGMARFTTELDVGNHLVRDEATDSDGVVEVRIGRLDSFLADDAPVLIKIDVEGEELPVLLGGRSVLANPSLAAVIVETFRPANHLRPQLVALEGLLCEHGFIPAAYDPRKRELRALTSPSEGAQNTIYVRNLPATMQRLLRSKPVRAFGENF